MLIEASWKFLELSRNVMTSVDAKTRLKGHKSPSQPRHPAVLIPHNCSYNLKGASLLGLVYKNQLIEAYSIVIITLDNFEALGLFKVAVNSHLGDLEPLLSII
jgi:hypothetical protein